MRKFYGLFYSLRTLFIIIGTSCLASVAIINTIYAFNQGDGRNTLAILIAVIAEVLVAVAILLGHLLKKERLLHCGFLLFFGFIVLSGIVEGLAYSFYGGTSTPVVKYNLGLTFQWVFALFMLAFVVFFILRYVFKIKAFNDTFLGIAFIVLAGVGILSYIFQIVRASAESKSLWIYSITPIIMVGCLPLFPIYGGILDKGMASAPKAKKAAPKKEEAEEEPAPEEKKPAARKKPEPKKGE